MTRLGDDAALARLAGDWTIADAVPSLEDAEKEMAGLGAKRLRFDTRELGRWDSSLVSFLLGLEEACARRKIEVEREGLPSAVRQLLELASAVPERKDTRRVAPTESFLFRTGSEVLGFFKSTAELLEFIGEGLLSLLKLARGSARFRFCDLAWNMQECGAQALPVVTLISVLIGLILAFVGAMQLKMFGAQIYVANLVAIGMAREMGAIMPGIIMAGRTGASFAAQLGTMQVNEEIDALKTMGIPAMEFLVLPRTLAMVIMMPLLCIYANFLGIMGGAVVSLAMFDLSAAQYFHQTANSVAVSDFGIGVFKSALFGVLVAVAGCLRGMQCGRSSAAVGAAATSAVVTGIVSIIVADSIVTVITTAIGI